MNSFNCKYLLLVLLNFALACWAYRGFAADNQELSIGSKKEKEEVSTGDSLIEQGKSKTNSGQYEAALKTLNKAHEYYILKKEAAPIPLNFERARANYYLGRYAVSIELLLKNIQSSFISDSLLLHSTYLLAEVYRASGNLEPSKKYAHQTIQMALVLTDSVFKAAALNRLGVAFYQESRHDSAEYYLLQSKELSERLNAEDLMTRNYNDLGELYFALEADQKARSFYKKALLLARTFDNRLNTLTNIARLDLKLKDYAPAIEKAQKALALAREQKVLTYEVDALKILARSHNELGQFKKATFYFAQYIEKREELLEENRNRQILELEEAYQSKQKEQRIQTLQLRQQEEQRRNRLYLIGLIITFVFLLSLTGLLYQLRSRNRQLKELNLTKDKFFSIIAHDLRSPIIALHGAGKKLDYYLRMGKYEKLIQMGLKLDHSIEQLNHLLNNLLNWAMSQRQAIPYHPELFDTKILVNETVRLYENYAVSKDIRLLCKLVSLKAYADINGVSTVLRNLLSNAIKFSKEGDVVEISNNNVKGNFAEIHIKDHGVGISEEKTKSLMKKQGASTPGSRGEKGLGLGFKLAQEFAEMNRGKLKVESSEGKGTLVILQLPIRKAV